MGEGTQYTPSHMRRRLPFRAVNRRGAPQYDPALQRHHLLPCELLGKTCFAPLIETLGKDWIGFDDFRRNGLLLPADVTPSFPPAGIRAGRLCCA